MKIHPTAIVPEGAKLADDVEIGPGTILSSQTELAAGCVIGAHVILENRVVVGEGTKIGHGAIIGANPQDLSFDGARTDTGVRIGRNNVIREYVTIHRATVADADTVVGDGNFIMVAAHLGHDVQMGDHVIAANAVLVAGHVKIADRCFLGGGSVFHQFIRIGTLAMIRGGCRFSKDIPPFLVATGEHQVAGINAIGLRRAGISADARAEIKRVFRLLYLSGLNMSQALEASASETWSSGEARELLNFVQSAKKRGVCAYVGKGGDAD